MPFSISTDDETTVLAFKERCTADDAIEIKDPLLASLTERPRLRFDTSEAEAVDTASLQLALSAIHSCQEFESSDDDFLRAALNRWGLAPPKSE